MFHKSLPPSPSSLDVSEQWRAGQRNGLTIHTPSVGSVKRSSSHGPRSTAAAAPAAGACAGASARPSPAAAGAGPCSAPFAAAAGTAGALLSRASPGTLAPSRTLTASARAHARLKACTLLYPLVGLECPHRSSCTPLGPRQGSKNLAHSCKPLQGLNTLQTFTHTCRPPQRLYQYFH